MLPAHDENIRQTIKIINLTFLTHFLAPLGALTFQIVHRLTAALRFRLVSADLRATHLKSFVRVGSLHRDERSG